MREHGRKYVRHVRTHRANRDLIAEHHARLAANRQLWVVEAEGVPVGFAAVSPNDPNIDTFFASAAVTDLYLAPGHRGRGLGRALLDRVIADVAARGLHALTITVMAGNPAAEVYRAAGFRPFTEKLVLPLVPGAVTAGPGYPGELGG